MIPPYSLSRLFVVLAVVEVEKINLFSVLDPVILTFIQVVVILGPLSITGVIFLLKRIENKNPDRVRWK